jgi:photosystem II stability/assembly factor-like uncharacterized protein
MGREITLKYAEAFGTKGKWNFTRFFYDVYRSDKIRELFSFIVWEIMHKFRLFSKKRYIKFNSNDVFVLKNKNLLDVSFKKEISELFAANDLALEVSDYNWKQLFINNGEIYGSIYPDDKELYKSIDNGKSVSIVKKFPERIKSIFISSQDTVFVCVKGAVHVSSDNGNTFKKTLDMGSHESWFRHNNEMTETPDKTLILGEYGNIWDKKRWRKLAYLYYSTDNGASWVTSDFLIQMGTNKHVHLVKYSRLLNKLFMADGDNKKKLWISDTIDANESKNPHWKPINKFHIQMGGYTSVVESDKKIFFGTDYQGGTNFLVETKDGKKYHKKIVPDPYRRSPINNMVQRKSKSGNEIWANLPFSTSSSKCLLMYTKDDGETWNKVFEYNGKDYTVWLLNSSSEIPDVLYFSIEDLKNKNRIVYKVVD